MSCVYTVRSGSCERAEVVSLVDDHTRSAVIYRHKSIPRARECMHIYMGMFAYIYLFGKPAAATKMRFRMVIELSASNTCPHKQNFFHDV